MQHVEIKPTALYDVLIMEFLFNQLNQIDIEIFIIVSSDSLKIECLRLKRVLGQTWSIWIVLHSNFLFLYSLYRSADWIGMFTVTSATIPRNSLLLYCIFMP